MGWGPGSAVRVSVRVRVILVLGLGQRMGWSSGNTHGQSVSANATLLMGADTLEGVMPRSQLLISNPPARALLIAASRTAQEK